MFPKRIQKNRILVRPDTPENKTESGIIIPDAYVEKPNVGEVVKVGHDSLVTELDIQVDVGDRVVYPRDAGIKLTFGGIEYLLMKKSEILYIE